MSLLYFILFTLWIIIAIFLYVKWYRKNASTWNINLLVSGFLAKILLGCLYGYIFQKYYGGDDTWLYHQQSLTETANLLEKPFEFLKSIFLQGNLERYEMDGIWKELEYTGFIKILAVFNLFSGGNYYLNVLLYGSITFTASIIFCNLFSIIKPERKKIFCIIFFFYVPLVFWTSGIRREGFIFLFLSLILYQFSNWFINKKIKHFALTILSLLLLAVFRYSFAMTLTPFLMLWWLLEATKGKINPWIMSFIFLLIVSFVFFVSKWTGPVNLPGVLVEQQNHFMNLKGGSYLPMEPLRDHFKSFLIQLPFALDHVLLRPYPFEKGSFFIQLFKLETWTLILLTLYFFISKPYLQKLPFAIPMILFIIVNYLIIGYTVPFLGAIIRYRAIIETIYIAWLFCFMHFNKIQSK